MNSKHHNLNTRSCDRRSFLGQSAAAAALPLLAPALSLAAEDQGAATKPAEYKRKIKLGVVGCGGRGSWIAKLFQSHGGYKIHGVADYFPEAAKRCGDDLGVDPSRRFSGLSGYQKLIASGIEAIAIEDIPYFYPEQSRAAVEAGLHVYMAKPVATDVPGCLAIEANHTLATAKKQCFLVDYQIPTEPLNIEVRQRILDGALGKIAYLSTFGFSSGSSDPPKTATIESRMQHLIWANDNVLGGGFTVNFDIHALDAAVWVLGGRPLSATGMSRVCRPEPHGDTHDVCSALLEFPGGVICNHTGQALRNNADSVPALALRCQIFGSVANAMIAYGGKVYVQGGPKHFGGGEVKNLYPAGAERNIATFYNDITQGRYANATAHRAVDSVLTAILVRDAADRRCRLTMEELLKENKRLPVDLSGLRA